MKSFRLHRIFLVLALALDAAVVAASFFAAWWLRFGSGLVGFAPPAPPIGAYMMALPLSIAVYLLVFNYVGLYQRRWAVVGTGDLSRILRGVVFATLLIFALGFLYRGFSYSRLVLVFMAVLNAVLLALARGILLRVQVFLRRRGVGVLRVAIIGDGPEAGEVAVTLKRHPGYGFRLVGFIGRRVRGRSPCLGPTARLERILAATGSDAVLIAPSRAAPRAEVAAWAVRCVRAGADCMMLADFFGLLTNRLRLEDLFGIPILSIARPPLASLWNRFVKRAVDLVLSVVALAILSLLFVLVAILIRIDSPGPVFFRQERVGRGGRIFGVLKFRSMRADAEKRTGPVWAVRNDSRRTRTGAFLRRTSIDELPQLLNVLAGQMSLVGPRPERQHFVDKFVREVPRYAERHQVKPGITGWAQVNGLRGNTPVEERTRYDLYYVENWSLRLDLRIMFRTAMEVFHHGEAY